MYKRFVKRCLDFVLSLIALIILSPVLLILVIMAGAVINPYVQLGKGCIVNTRASVDHDCNVGDYVHVAVGAHLCGTVEVGAYTWIGAGATVSNNVSICPECMIGAGAVVVKNLEEKGTYVGVPAGRVG